MIRKTDALNLSSNLTSRLSMLDATGFLYPIYSAPTPAFIQDLLSFLTEDLVTRTRYRTLTALWIFDVVFLAYSAFLGPIVPFINVSSSIKWYNVDSATFPKPNDDYLKLSCQKIGKIWIGIHDGT